MRRITVVQDILKANDAIAAENRRVFDDNGVTVMNWLSSPGAGKTTLLEKTLPVLAARGIRAAVVEGDVQTTRDAERIDAVGIQAVQVTTGGTCHLDASMVRQTLDEIPLAELDLLIIENVGNLVCPAGFYLGEHVVITLLSVTEGHDKPLKYPKAFRSADTMVITKSDLIPYTNFDLDEAKTFALQINPDLHIVETSCTTGAGIDEWANWISDLCGQNQTES